MTQMLLFDSIANLNDAPAAAALVPVTPQSKTTAADPAASSQRSVNVASQLQHDSGVHHMGDLARLVLLRYDLVAKRRAQMAARKAQAARSGQTAQPATAVPATR